MNTPHPQADILRAIADGKPIEGRYLNSPWVVLQDPFNAKDWEFRIKPETININGHEVPCPVQEPLKDGQEFYVADGTQIGNPVLLRWSPISEAMQGWFECGLIHLTKEAAIAHTEALLSFTRRDK